MSNQKGMSLIEIVIVIGIFSVLSILVSQSLLLTLKGSRKTEVVVKVRENVNYALGIIERQLRNANSITDCTNPLSISYLDDLGNPGTFSCQNLSGNGYIASGSALTKLTVDSVDITACSFSCTAGSQGSPPSVTFTVTAQDSTATGISNAIVSASKQVYLRTY